MSKLKPYLYKYKKQVAIFFIMLLISISFDIFQVIYTMKLTNCTSNTKRDELIGIIVLILVCAIGIQIFRLISRIIIGFISMDITKEVKSDILKHLGKLKVEVCESDILGDFLTRWARDLQEFQKVFENNLIPLTIAPISAIIFIFFLGRMKFDLLVVGLIPTIISVFFINKAGKFINIKNFIIATLQAKKNNMMMDSCNCIQIVKVFNILDVLQKKYRRLLKEEYVEIFLQLKIFHLYNGPFKNLLIGNIGSVFCYVYGGYLCYVGNMGVAELIGFISLFGTLTAYIIQIPDLIVNIRSNVFYINRVLDIFDFKIENIYTDELENKKDSDIVIKFNNVTFSYDENKNVLEDCSFEVRHGEKVAFVGEGKTSILKLICGFHLIQKGNIEIFGEQIKKERIGDIRQRISFVVQHPIIFPGTIAENISCEYINNRKKIIEVSKLAYTDEFIIKFPNGYDEYIGGGKGTNLSGGQKQRIAIARALFKDSELFLMDDYTSAIDKDIRKKIYTNLYSAIKDRTIVITSNKLCDIEGANKIFVIKDGKILDKGSHKYLLKNCDYYRELLEGQL